MPYRALQVIAEHAESNGGLSGGAGFGDDVDRNSPALAEFQQLLESGAADAVAGEIDVRGVLFLGVVQGRFQELDGCPGPQIGAADADDDENVRILTDALRRRLDTGKFRFIIIGGEAQPAQKIVAQSGAAVKRLMGRADLLLQGAPFVGTDKAFQITCFERD